MKFEYIDILPDIDYYSIIEPKPIDVIEISRDCTSSISTCVIIKMPIIPVYFNGLFICHACISKKLNTIYVVKATYKERSFFEPIVQDYLQFCEDDKNSI